MMHISYDVPDWNKGQRKETSPVRKSARPWMMVHEQKSKIAVVCFHGYTGYPGELIRPGIDLYDAGFDVYACRYTGHGTCTEDFIVSDANDWLQTARNCFDDVASRYEQVYIVGHSMGGAIATIIASEHPEVKRMALIAPALEIYALKHSFKMRFFLRVGRFFMGDKVKIEWHLDPDMDFHYEGDPGDDQYLGEQYWQYLFPKQCWELYKLSKMGKKALAKVQADTLSLSGGLDRSVTENASVMVAEKPLGQNKHIHDPAASHLMPYDKDRAAEDRAMKAIRDWFVR